MGIVHVRVDDRLIHGQVAVVWTNTVKANRIMVINDEVAGDDVQKSILRMATPPGTALSVLSVDKAAKRIQDGVYDNDSVLVILKKPSDGLRLLEAGVELETINIGNLSNRPDSMQIKKTVSLLDEDIQALKSLHEAGIRLTAQMLPNEKEEDLVNIMKDHNLF